MPGLRRTISAAVIELGVRGLTMKTISFTISGQPQAQKRHRDRRGGGKYDPSAKEKKEFLAKCMQYKPETPLDEPIALAVNCYFARPKSHYRTGKFSHLLKRGIPEYHTNKPDGDNILKFIGDALGGLFWSDDRIICYQLVTKVYSIKPKTVIAITKFDPFRIGFLPIRSGEVK